MPILRGVIVLLAMLATVVGGVTWIALEMGEVVILRTVTPQGETRRTRVWIADADGASWIEAGHPDREFYADIRGEPNVEIERAGKVHAYLAKPQMDSESHDKLRTLLRQKYGWADRWVASLFDTARSIAIRLEPRERAASRKGSGPHPRHTRRSEARLT